jgi:hypothetical protein
LTIPKTLSCFISWSFWKKWFSSWSSIYRVHIFENYNKHAFVQSVAYLYDMDILLTHGTVNTVYYINSVIVIESSRFYQAPYLIKNIFYSVRPI